MVVTKSIDVARIRDVVAAGAVDLGENRVQEATDKQAQLAGASLRWHLIGHLQTNKARRAATGFASVQSIDSERIGFALADRRPAEDAPLPVLIEVDFTRGLARTGASAEQATSIAAAVLSRPSLELRGLMTVAPMGSEPQARAAFVQLRRLRDDLEQHLGVSLPDLSMGMSGDFETAIEEGATIVRLGTVILGGRPADR